MDDLFVAGYAEPAPPIALSEECWYLPLFGVYHPQKRDRIRGVFDASAKLHGLSLNNVLMTGPDLINSLVGVLMRFRKDRYAIMADIGLMFYCFLQPFACCGLRKTADVAEEKYGPEVKAFVYRNFYVDDALSSHPSAAEAIDLLSKTKSALKEFGNLRLHKISSNSEDILSAFESTDLSKDLTNHELGGTLPTQRSLGICWNLQTDQFTFRVNLNDRPYTRRGVLASINSLFDPLGLVAPVVVEGKAILREAMTEGGDWDEPLSETQRQRWDIWKTSLKDLEKLKVTRTYGNASLSKATKRDLYIFSDASQSAIAAVAYIKFAEPDNHNHLGFVMGKAKLAPKHGHSIPRLELCGAVLATELYSIIQRELAIDSVKFFTDSRVVIGNIQNETKRFYAYVSNRVERIRARSKPSDWFYISSKSNPADEATRFAAARDMKNSLWLNGPHEIRDLEEKPLQENFPVLDSDLEVRTMKADLVSRINSLEPSRFNQFSKWMSLIKCMATLKHIAAGKCTENSTGLRWHICAASETPIAIKDAKNFVILTVQSSFFSREIEALKKSQLVPRDSPLKELNPFIDSNGLLRVGGRLCNADLELLEKNPMIIPKHSHIAVLIIAYYHREVKHQGRSFTEGAIRSAGFWIIGCRRLMNSHIHSCVPCRKTRGKQEVPIMADLPPDRLDPAPPFTYIGVDVFGPWQIVTRRTRGGQVNSKRWAVIFTCLVIRAVHIEIIEEMTS